MLNINVVKFVMQIIRGLDFVSIFLNSYLISEGWKFKIDLEYHCIINSFIAQYFA